MFTSSQGLGFLNERDEDENCSDDGGLKQESRYHCQDDDRKNQMDEDHNLQAYLLQIEYN